MTILHPSMFPDAFDNEEHLEDFMSIPSQDLIDDLARLEGDIIILGVAGKMGTTMARMAKRAAPDKRILGVARFSDIKIKEKLESWGVETLTCDFLQKDQVAELPRLPNVIYMAGKKFGTDGAEAFTWAMNTYAPALIGDHFRDSRIIAFSTILVFPYVPVKHGGSLDGDAPLAMPGEYANSCVGRERTIQYFSKIHGFPARNIRMAYSIDMRYGVLQEVATHVVNGETIDLTAGHADVIWQGDANSQILRTLHHCTNPASPIIISGPGTTSIKSLALSIGNRLGIEPKFTGEEMDNCVAVNSGLAADLFGYPMVPLERMVTWIADWVSKEKGDWGKPSHFEVRDGVF